MKQSEFLLLTALLLAGFLFTGCTASQYLGRTQASYKSPQGIEVLYDSNKNQEGFKAYVELDPEGKVKAFRIETTATTPESVVAAVAQANLENAKLLQSLFSQIQQGATKGATAIPLKPTVPPVQ